MRILIIAFLTMLLPYSATTAQVESCVAAQGQPLRIGAVFPPDTLFGTDAADPYRGVLAMTTAINECGGVAGRPVELVPALAGNHETVLSAVDDLSGEVPVVVGSGSAVVGDVLAKAADENTFFYWEVSEPLDDPHAYALSPRPNNTELGAQAAAFVQADVQALLDNSLRVALVYEDNSRGRMVAEGVMQALNEPPLIEHAITERRTDGYRLAVEIREQRINVVIAAVFERDADRLWSQLREADANPAAWVQVGGDRYRHDICSRIGNTDGIISISAAGTIDAAYRQTAVGPIYEAYLAAYETQFQRLPGERADLAASGMYVLLREILPHVSGSFTPAAIQQAAATTISTGTALMGEGWSLDPITGINQTEVAIVAQQQNGAFCTIAPDTVATCALPLQPLPTWRDRAKTSSC